MVLFAPPITVHFCDSDGRTMATCQCDRMPQLQERYRLSGKGYHIHDYEVDIDSGEVYFLLMPISSPGIGVGRS